MKTETHSEESFFFGASPHSEETFAFGYGAALWPMDHSLEEVELEIEGDDFDQEDFSYDPLDSEGYYQLELDLKMEAQFENEEYEALEDTHCADFESAPANENGDFEQEGSFTYGNNSMADMDHRKDDESIIEDFSFGSQGNSFFYNDYEIADHQSDDQNLFGIANDSFAGFEIISKQDAPEEAENAFQEEEIPAGENEFILKEEAPPLYMADPEANAAEETFSNEFSSGFEYSQSEENAGAPLSDEDEDAEAAMAEAKEASSGPALPSSSEFEIVMEQPDRLMLENFDVSLGELHEPHWSVVTFEGCAVKGLTYDEAAKWIDKLKNQDIPGLCIVTDTAAERVSE